MDVLATSFHASASYGLSEVSMYKTLTFPFLGPGVYIWWNGMVEWNSGMDYWNGGMLHRTYLIIQHVLYSEQ